MTDDKFSCISRFPDFSGVFKIIKYNISTLGPFKFHLVIFPRKVPVSKTYPSLFGKKHHCSYDAHSGSGPSYFSSHNDNVNFVVTAIRKIGSSLECAASSDSFSSPI